MFKRIITMTGPTGVRYVRRTKDYIGITDNISLATDYFTACDDHEELLASDFSFIDSRIPADVILEIKDAKVEIVLEPVDLSSTLVHMQIKTAAISKLSQKEIKILGLESEAMFAKLKYGSGKIPSKVGEFRVRPQFRPTASTFRKQLGSSVRGSSNDWECEDDDGDYDY